MILPIKLNSRIITYSKEFYYFDTENLNIFPINKLTADIFNLITKYDESKLISILEKNYNSALIKKELEKVKKFISLENNSYLSKKEYDINSRVDFKKEWIKYLIPSDMMNTNNIKKATNDEEYILVLELKDLTDDNVIEKIDASNYYILINLYQNQINNESIELGKLKSYLKKRIGRFRINLWIKSTDFIQAYQVAIKTGLTKFDIRFIDEEYVNFNDEYIEDIKKFLTSVVYCDDLNLGVIQDVVKILSYKDNIRSYNNKCKCWAKDICNSVFSYKNDSLCKLYKIYIYAGILSCIKYHKYNLPYLYKILSEDLPSYLSNAEKNILAGNYYWSKNLKNINIGNIKQFNKIKNKKVITMKDCNIRGV